MCAWEVTEVDPEDGARVFHALDAEKVRAPGPGVRGKAPASACRYYGARDAGGYVQVWRLPGGQVRNVDPDGGCCFCYRRPCVHETIAGLVLAGGDEHGN